MGNLDQVNRLGTSRISKLILEFSIPAIIGLVVNGLYNIIDSIFLGHGVGTVGIATATIALPIMTLSIAVSLLVGAGGNALVALRLGEGKFKEAEKVLGNAFVLTLVFAVVLTALVNIFIDPLLTLSGAHEDTWESSHVFIRIISFGFILQFFGMGFNNFIRTAGDPNRALYTMIAGTVVCIVFNYLFVIQFGWGVAGSAWATVIGQGVSAVLVLWYFVFSKRAPFKLRIPCLRLSSRLVRSICALGSASFFLQFAGAIVSLILNNQLSFYGDLSEITGVGAQAAIGVVNRVAMFAFFPVLGVAIAVQPIFGYNYGAQDFKRVKITFRLAFYWMAIIGSFFWLLIHILPSQIVSLFAVTEGLKDFTVTAMQVQMFFMPLIGLQVLAANYFQSSGQPLRSSFISLTRQIIYLIPLLYLLPVMAGSNMFLPGVTSLEAIYYTYPIADVLSLATAGVMIMLEWKKLNEKIQKRAAGLSPPH